MVLQNIPKAISPMTRLTTIMIGMLRSDEKHPPVLAIGLGLNKRLALKRGLILRGLGRSILGLMAEVKKN